MAKRAWHGLVEEKEVGSMQEDHGDLEVVRMGQRRLGRMGLAEISHGRLGGGLWKGTV